MYSQWCGQFACDWYLTDIWVTLVITGVITNHQISPDTRHWASHCAVLSGRARPMPSPVMVPTNPWPPAVYGCLSAKFEMCCLWLSFGLRCDESCGCSVPFILNQLFHVFSWFLTGFSCLTMTFLQRIAWGSASGLQLCVVLWVPDQAWILHPKYGWFISSITKCLISCRS